MVSKQLLYKVLVLGSTGNTGKHVVRMLLDQGNTDVVAVARSKARLIETLGLDEKQLTNLSIKEASIADLTVDELKDLTEGCTAVVSCLGHNFTFKGMFRDGYFVSDAAKNLSATMPSTSRYIHMGFDGYTYAGDPKRSGFERGVLRLLRFLLPPVKDNFKSADHLYKNVKAKDWVVVRPGDLYDKDEADVYGANAKTDEYEVHDHTFGDLFGELSASRSDTARFMVKLATMNVKDFKATYNHKMPVIYDAGSKKSKPEE